MDIIHINPSKDDFLVPTKITSNDEKNFYSSERGQRIVNALTGEKYIYKVGSYEEQNFWRVTVPFTKNGITNSVKLFYISPSEYEYHRNVCLDTDIKIKWSRSTTKSNKHVSTIDTPKYTSVK